MTEKLLHFIWQFGYYNSANLLTADGEKLTIIFPGTLNKNSGPDFSNAKLKIGETTFFGNIELHLKTSDWEKHGHQNDLQYRNVVLHVVFQHDKKLPHAIPVLELEPRISVLLLEKYEALMKADSFVPCNKAISSVSNLVWFSWKERLLIERLTSKAEGMLTLLKESKDHWEETFWWLLARNFGMKVNSGAFEIVARSIPLSVLAKHKSSIHQIEALLFGQAGLLNNEFWDEYPRLLQREYQYLKKKLTLLSPAVTLQFLRMRPVSFPTIRLAQLAVLVQQSSHLFSRILEENDSKKVRNLFEVTANDYWHYHYTFQQTSAFKKKTLGSDTVDNILINTAIPVLYAYGLYHNEEKYREKALRWLQDIAAEKNRIIKGFSDLNVKAGSAYDSQALIELRNKYCSAKRCLQCSVGSSLLKKEVQSGTTEKKLSFLN